MNEREQLAARDEKVEKLLYDKLNDLASLVQELESKKIVFLNTSKNAITCPAEKDHESIQNTVKRITEIRDLLRLRLHDVAKFSEEGLVSDSVFDQSLVSLGKLAKSASDCLFAYYDRISELIAWCCAQNDRNWNQTVRLLEDAKRKVDEQLRDLASGSLLVTQEPTVKRKPKTASSDSSAKNGENTNKETKDEKLVRSQQMITTKKGESFSVKCRVHLLAGYRGEGQQNPIRLKCSLRDNASEQPIRELLEALHSLYKSLYGDERSSEKARLWCIRYLFWKRTTAEPDIDALYKMCNPSDLVSYLRNEDAGLVPAEQVDKLDELQKAVESLTKEQASIESGNTCAVMLNVNQKSKNNSGNTAAESGSGAKKRKHSERENESKMTSECQLQASSKKAARAKSNDVSSVGLMADINICFSLASKRHGVADALYCIKFAVEGWEINGTSVTGLTCNTWPFSLMANSNQESETRAIIFWYNAFWQLPEDSDNTGLCECLTRDYGRHYCRYWLSDSPKSVSFDEFFKQLKLWFETVTGCSLEARHEQFVRNCFPHDSVSFTEFARTKHAAPSPIRGKFWSWIFSVKTFVVTNTFVRFLWQRNLLFGFCTQEDAKRVLESDSDLQHNSILYRFRNSIDHELTEYINEDGKKSYIEVKGIALTVSWKCPRLNGYGCSIPLSLEDYRQRDKKLHKKVLKCSRHARHLYVNHGQKSPAFWIEILRGFLPTEPAKKVVKKGIVAVGAYQCVDIDHVQEGLLNLLKLDSCNLTPNVNIASPPLSCQSPQSWTKTASVSSEASDDQISQWLSSVDS